MISATPASDREHPRRTPDLEFASSDAIPAALLEDVLTGLARRQRAIPSRYFYDAQGSQLFEWITRLPGYYVTRTERELLEEHGDALAARFAGQAPTVVDLGAGDGHKSRLVIARLRAHCRAVAYAPIDISREALDHAAERVRQSWPDVQVRPVHADYRAGLRSLAAQGANAPRLVLFLGSSIGNLERCAAIAFLQDLRAELRPGDHVLVGFDLVKAADVLQRAYDDPQGVTHAFNLNLLARINRELGADFDVTGFRHRATWDPRRPAMESWLESRRSQTVHVAGHSFTFAARERIHTEISWKYTPTQVRALAHASGFQEAASFQDARHWFLDALWRVPDRAAAAPAPGSHGSAPSGD